MYCAKKYNLFTMINSKEFSKRLHTIMEKYDLSASAFADKIGVGRSSISHIISGRNKPSLDFILKILEAFPEIDLYWLMNGKGNFTASQEKKIKNPPSSPTEKKEENPVNITKNEILEKTNIFPDAVSSSKTIEKIIILYSDGSFDSFEKNK